MSNSWIPIIKPTLLVQKEFLEIASRRCSKKKYNQLIAALVAEILKQHPDINPAKAKQKALEAIFVSPKREYLHGKKNAPSCKVIPTEKNH